MEMETTIIFNWAQLMKNQRKISKDQDINEGPIGIQEGYKNFIIYQICLRHLLIMYLQRFNQNWKTTRNLSYQNL